ncbi:flagellar filament capping protein FliD [Blastococcus deserti]|uniref:Flagellar hook-associated protein 2 n=1 Tax=Blastococcus deserti TaxID=2259033 RepID=A0ABW4X942_9ACTN
MTMSLSTGLISGMDTGTLVSQLLQAEAAPQTALKTRLGAAQMAASAYRTVNTTFAAIRAAAEALSASALTSARKAASSSTDVTATASATAVNGSTVTFAVTGLAKTHRVLSVAEWGSTTANVHKKADGSAQELTWPIEIIDVATGTSRGSVSVGTSATLADAVKAINDKKLGVRATAVQVETGKYRLQLTSETSGTPGVFAVKSNNEMVADAGLQFTVNETGQNATIDLGGSQVASSPTNTFSNLMDGVSVTVTKVDPTRQITVSVTDDPDSVATKVQTLVDAVNSALSTVKTYTSNAPGSTAALKGDFSVSSLSGRLLDAVSEAVGPHGSPAKVGFQLTRDGKITFDKAKFTTALKDTPELATRMVAGGPATTLNGAAVPAVTGIAERLLGVAKSASDSTTGSLVALAKGQDSVAKDIQDRIAAWDLRLAKRKETLTRQFTAMETALSGLRNQSTWLAGQINSLPSS